MFCMFSAVAAILAHNQFFRGVNLIAVCDVILALTNSADESQE